MNKILVINPFGIGDVLFSTPLLKAIKKKFPAASIAYICNKRTKGILKNNPNITNIYIFEKDEYRTLWEESKLKCLKKIRSFIKTIKEDKYDVLIDMSLGYLYSLALSIFAAIPVRIGFNYRNRGRFLTHKIDIQGFDNKHVIEYYLELGRALGIDLTDKDMNISITNDDAAWRDKFLEENGVSGDGKVCGIIPGCGASWGKDASYRRWSAWKFAEVSDYMAAHHKYKIIIFGNSQELTICRKVKSEMKNGSVQACGKTTLGQFAALLDRCDLVITNDGGPLHMAIALKKKTIAIFGPVDERIYGPYPPGDRYITVTCDTACRPCYKNFKYKKCDDLACLKGIGPDKVLEAVKALIGKKR